MAWLTRTLHEAGLKVGLYTDAGINGCGGKGQGSYGHYQQDVNTFAKWGFDAVKVDFCGGIQQGLNPASAYAELHEAIVHNSSNRPMLLSVCDYLQPGQYESEAVRRSKFLASNSEHMFGPKRRQQPEKKKQPTWVVPGDVVISSAPAKPSTPTPLRRERSG